MEANIINLKIFTWSCLLIAALALGLQVLSSSVQNQEAVSLFTSTMIIMTVGFNLVRRELAKLRPK